MFAGWPFLRVVENHVGVQAVFRLQFSAAGGDWNRNIQAAGDCFAADLNGRDQGFGFVEIEEQSTLRGTAGPFDGQQFVGLCDFDFAVG